MKRYNSLESITMVKMHSKKKILNDHGYSWLTEFFLFLIDWARLYSVEFPHCLCLTDLTRNFQCSPMKEKFPCSFNLFCQIVHIVILHHCRGTLPIQCMNVIFLFILLGWDTQENILQLLRMWTETVGIWNQSSSRRLVGWQPRPTSCSISRISAKKHWKWWK